MTKARRIFLILFLINLGLIWGNSVLDSAHSFALSDQITDRVQSAVEGRVPDAEDAKEPLGERISKVVRKCAHLAEYFTLGLLALLCLNALGREQVLLLALCGICTALIDETIQIFVRRSSMVRDIWIDLAGFTAGCLVALGVRRILQRIKQQRIKPWKN